jgi:hypothetical protein
MQIPELRERLISLLPAGIGFPQITFRLGFCPRVPPTPRRPVSDVVTTQKTEQPAEHEPVFDY